MFFFPPDGVLRRFPDAAYSAIRITANPWATLPNKKNRLHEWDTIQITDVGWASWDDRLDMKTPDKAFRVVSPTPSTDSAFFSPKEPLVAIGI